MVRHNRFLQISLTALVSAFLIFFRGVRGRQE